MSDAVPMPTEDQKPQHVQATEDALDFVGNKVQQATTTLVNSATLLSIQLKSNPLGDKEVVRLFIW